MIRKLCHQDLKDCVEVIQKSFITVADTFGITPQNAPRFTAFAISQERLLWELEQEKRLMFGYYESGSLVGYFSLLVLDEHICELGNLCVLEEFRHKKIGRTLFAYACSKVKQLGCNLLRFSIVEDNTELRRWYESLGAVHVETKKYDFFPFTCGYMEKLL